MNRHAPILLSTLAICLLILVGFQQIQTPMGLPAHSWAPLSPSTATVTATPGWWQNITWATTALKTLPPIRRPQFQLQVAPKAGEPVPYQILSCPQDTVQINSIRTAQPGWWHIYGTVNLVDLWYWKAEISASGHNWRGLYRAEHPVVADVLVRFNLSTVSSGNYQVRLTGVDRTGNYPEPCVVQIHVG